MIKVEEKLFQNRYRVDADLPHIRIKDESVCNTSCAAQKCTVCCPAGCWTIEDGKISLMTDGCLECGTCRALSLGKIVTEWSYPENGYGVSFRMG